MITLSGFVMFGGHFPPMHAQSRYQVMPVISNEDNLQDDHIAGINAHLAATDKDVRENRDDVLKKIEDLYEKLGQFHADLAGVEAENRIFAGLMFSGLTITFVVTRNREKKAS